MIILLIQKLKKINTKNKKTQPLVYLSLLHESPNDFDARSTVSRLQSVSTSLV